MTVDCRTEEPQVLVFVDHGVPRNDIAALAAARDQFAPPVQIHVIDAQETGVRHAYDIAAREAMLICPDGHLAWRGAVTTSSELEDYLFCWYTAAAPTKAAPR